MLALGKLLELTLAGREPAEKTQLTVEGVRMRWLSEGALEVRPPEARDNGLDLLLSAGIHGNETAPIELLDRLLHDIARGDLKPRARILFLFGNPEAIRKGERFVEQDVNRLFNGRHEQSSGTEALRACELERLAASFFSLPDRQRLHYDLHTAIRGSKIEQFALVSVEGRSPAFPSRTGASARGRDGSGAAAEQAVDRVQLVHLRQARCRGFHAGTGQGAAVRAERRGQRLAAGNSSASRSSKATSRRWPKQQLDGLQLFSVAREIIKHSDAFRLNLPADIENFSELEVGYVLAEDLANTRWIIEEEGARIIFPNPKVKNGLRAGILIVPTTDENLA